MYSVRSSTRSDTLPLTHAVEEFGTGMYVELLVDVPLVGKRRPLGNTQLFLDTGDVIAAREHGKYVTLARSQAARICNENTVAGQSVYFIGQTIG